MNTIKLLNFMDIRKSQLVKVETFVLLGRGGFATPTNPTNCFYPARPQGLFRFDLFKVVPFLLSFPQVAPSAPHSGYA